MATDTDSYAFFVPTIIANERKTEALPYIMRRIISFLLIFAALAANARHVSPEEAQSIATEFFNSGSPSKVKKAPRRAAQAPRSAENHSESQPYYIFNASDNTGFIIISGDTRAKKILGYSDSGNFDAENMPPQLAALMEHYAQQLKTSTSSNDDDSWKSTFGIGSNGVLLETANWGQGYPYNLMTPEKDGLHCPTGCAATAMAIIMKYHNWPNKGRSQYSYKWEGEELSCDFENETFDYTKMPKSINDSECNHEEAMEISKLMYAAGVAINMAYDITESTAYADNIPYQFYRHFKYNIPGFVLKNGGCPEHKSYTDTEWLQIIKEQLDSNNPVLYSYTGHIYVVDGYDDNDYLHVNWGWDGAMNGYFAINNMGDNEAIMTPLVPDKDADSSYETVVLSDMSLGGGASIFGCALNMNTTDIVKGETYEIALTCLSQVRSNCGMHDVAIALADSNGQIKEILTEPMKTGFEYEESEYVMVSGVGASFGIKIEHEIEKDDLIMCVIKDENAPDDDYRPIKTPCHIKPYLNAHGNTPIMSSVNIEIDDDITLHRYVPKPGFANSGDKEEINNGQLEYLSNSNLGLIATSIYGIPQIFFNEDNLGYYSNYLKNRSVEMSINNYNGGNVKVRLCRFDEMEDITVVLDEPGTLHDKMPDVNTRNVKSLKISGYMNIDDVKFTNLYLNSIQTLDLSVPNEIPTWLMTNLRFLKTLVLPNNVEKIKDNAFFMGSMGCLEIMDIPSSVSVIEGNAFSLPGLNTFVVHSAQPIELTNPDVTFKYYTDSYHILYVPTGSKSNYQSAEGWMNFTNIVEYDTDWKLMRKDPNLKVTIL